MRKPKSELIKKPFETIAANPERVWLNVEKTDGCWHWTGRINKYGYGQLSAGNTELLAHRAAYFLSNQSMDRALCVMHKCDNPKCCNPDHLILGTHAENMADMLIKGRRKGVNSNENNGRAKLSAEAADRIRSLRNSGVTLKHIANEFKVGISTIGRVCNRENWI